MYHTRIQAIRDAATLLFLRQGYSRTQISHIAKAVGVSVGTIYHDFSGKQEILHLILKCTIDPAFIEREFHRPITNDLFPKLEEEVIAAFQQAEDAFSKNLPAMENYSFEALISDAFELLSRYAVGCLFIEKNQTDLPRLTECYKAYRKQFFVIMTQYIAGFIERGVVRPLEHVELTANLIIEILAWWAMDRRYISFESWDLSDELAKKVCLDNIINAYQQSAGESR